MQARTKWTVFVAVSIVLALMSAPAIGGRRTTETRTFKVKSGGDLIVQIENAAADIEVRTWAKSEVKVRVDGIPEERVEDLEIGESGNTVRVEYHGNDRRWGRYGHVRVFVDVPSEFNLDLQTSGGDIGVKGRVSGEIRAGTAGGDVEIDDVDGTVELETAGGDIITRDVLGDANLKTSGGDIEIGSVKGEVLAHTSGGDITVVRVESDLDARTAGGDITIGDIGGYAAVATAGGDVELGRVSGTADVKTAGGDIELRGASGHVTARTAGGDILLENVTGSIAAETAGGDVVGELIPSGSRDSRLQTAGGDIELYIPADAKVSISARIRIHGGRGWWGGDEGDYDVSSDFEAVKHERNRKGVYAEFVLNGGGSTIELKTANGDIEIRKLKRQK